MFLSIDLQECTTFQPLSGSDAVKQIFLIPVLKNIEIQDIDQRGLQIIFRRLFSLFQYASEFLDLSSRINFLFILKERDQSLKRTVTANFLFLPDFRFCRDQIRPKLQGTAVRSLIFPAHIREVINDLAELDMPVDRASLCSSLANLVIIK